MGQVNVNTPGDGGTAGDPEARSGAGFILGIIVAILIIALLVYFLVLQPPANGDGADGDGNGDGVTPSGWVLTNRA